MGWRADPGFQRICAESGMIARILSGGPVFVPRKARRNLRRYQSHMDQDCYLNWIWFLRKGEA